MVLCCSNGGIWLDGRRLDGQIPYGEGFLQGVKLTGMEVAGVREENAK